MPNAPLPVVYIVFKTNAGPTSTRFGGFISRLKKTGHMPQATYKAVALEDLTFAIDAQARAAIYDTQGNEQFADADFVYFKSWESMPETVGMLVSYLRAKGIPYEDAAVARAGMHKPSQTWRLWAQGVPVIPTVTGFSVPSSTLLHTALGTGPYLIKPAKGEKGKGIQVCQTYQRLRQLITPQPSAWLVQPFIQNEGDYRVFVYGYEVRGAIFRRAAAGKVVNNTSQGGSSEYIAPNDVPQAVRQAAVAAARATEYAVAGVDVILGTTGAAAVLEVNQGSQIVTGHHTDKKMAAFADYLTERITTRQVRRQPNNRLEVIGRYATANLPELGVKGVFAKVDTGAYQSSIHATNIHEVDTPDGPVLEFTVLQGHGKVAAGFVPGVSRVHEYEKVTVRNSFGTRQTRYVIKTRIAINGRMMKTGITLADRADMVAPLLLGRRFLRGRYSVNVEINRHNRHD